MRSHLPRFWCALGLAALGATLPGCSSNPGVADAAGGAQGGKGQGNAGAPAAGAPDATVAGPFVIGVMARQAGACEPVADTAAPVLALGHVDRLLASQYPATLLIGSSAQERITLTGLQVELQSLAGGALFEPYTLVTTGFVDPEAVALAAVNLLPSAPLESLEPGRVVAHLSALGKTPSGVAVRSVELPFFIEVCDGCLISYPSWARDPSSADSAYRCLSSANAEPPEPEAQLPCELGVDLPAPCTMCSDALAACQRPANNPYVGP